VPDVNILISNLLFVKGAIVTRYLLKLPSSVFHLSAGCRRFGICN